MLMVIMWYHKTLYYMTSVMVKIDRDTDVIKKDGKLYDLVHQTDVFTKDYYFDIITLYAFTDVPPAIQRYIIARAAVRAATQLYLMQI